MEAKRAVVKPSLPPGFRFRPTDQELVVHYLRPRALDAPVPAAVDIPDVRLLAHDPSDLLPPGFSEPERYFFTCKEAKYVKGRRANRATGAGYWKATGKEKAVAVAVPVPGAQPPQQQVVLVGMKRSLVFYRGKPPTGSKTEWVMHEYRLAGAGLAPCRRSAKVGAAEQQPVVRQPNEGWVLCRVFRKKGPASAGSTAAAQEEEEDKEQEQEEGDDDGAAAESSSTGFIDFFARADAARRRAASPSSCVTDASHEQSREQETTSKGDAA